jgi:four helix bundle protein
MTAVHYDLEERLLEYAARIIRLSEHMTRSTAGAHVAQQVLRSGTSPLPNHGEAQAAESNRYFVHKLKICLKERRETHRWLLLIKRVPLVKAPGRVDALLKETDELVRIFVTSIKTAQKNDRARDGEKNQDSMTPYPAVAEKFDVQSSTFDVRRSAFAAQR